jgi:biopolymer transport protein ExbD
MAEINTDSGDHGKKGHKARSKKLSTRVDFTPMVDLMFLLITFFMLATTFMKPQTMEIGMPSKDKVTDEEKTKIKASQAVTIILGKNNKVFYYEGTIEHGVDPKVTTTNYSSTGIRQYLLNRNAYVVTRVKQLKAELNAEKITDTTYARLAKKEREWKQAPIVVIKATDESTYKNLVDILDEMQICNIGRYAVVDITDYDKKLIKDKNI